jgi:hypothetical protein
MVLLSTMLCYYVGSNKRKVNGMKIIETIKALYSPPSPETMALRELEQSRRELLAAHNQQEYATKMVEFHKGKIKRLTAFLKETMEEQS